jgi:hypothetical protein
MTSELTETEAKEQGEKPKSARYWHNQIDAALGREKKWRDRAEKVVKRYMDERPDNEDGGGDRRINILWSNTEVLKAVLFERLGAPDVRRLFPQPGKDNKIARTSALVMERALVACGNRYDPEGEIQDAVVDYLLTARGQLWLEYEAEISEDADGKQAISYQSAKLCHVCHDDWTHGPGKKWRQVPWVARMHLFTKDDFGREFPDIDLNVQKIPFNFTLKEGEKRTDEQGAADFKRAKVWEIWDKNSQTRIYIADGYEWELERVEDPYRLEAFFPCPKPLFGIKTSDSLLPSPEYCQYQDQAAELDRINQRLYVLVESLKVCGIYDGSSEDDTLSQVGTLDDGQFIPYKNMAALAQGGGLAAAFQVRDLAPIAVAIQQLANRAVSLIQSIYEITGISDVIRGSTDPNETLGAQQLKARFGSQRMQKRQKEVQMFVKEAYRLKAEIISEHFEREQLSQMTGILLPSEMERQKAKQLLTMAEQMKKQQEMMAQQAQQQQQMPSGPQQAQLPPPQGMAA